MLSLIYSHIFLKRERETVLFGGLVDCDVRVLFGSTLIFRLSFVDQLDLSR